MRSIGILGSDYPNLKPKMHVNIGDTVRAGDTLFEDKKIDTKSELGDQVIFNYQATVDNKEFEGGKGEGVTIELGKDLFLQGFDKQLIGVKKGDEKIVEAKLPENFPEKEVANKNAEFVCKILFVKNPEKVSINDEFAKNCEQRVTIHSSDVIQSI